MGSSLADCRRWHVYAENVHTNNGFAVDLWLRCRLIGRVRGATARRPQRQRQLPSESAQSCEGRRDGQLVMGTLLSKFLHLLIHTVCMCGCRPGECFGEFELWQAEADNRAQLQPRARITTVKASSPQEEHPQSTKIESSVALRSCTLLAVGQAEFERFMRPTFVPLMLTLQHRNKLLRHCYLFSDWTDEHLTLFSYWMSELRLMEVC